jgi:serine/threonine protein kinase
MERNLRLYLEKNSDSITWKQKLSIISHICYGLKLIHDLGSIHKDLHPGNILNNNNGNMLISDFGFCMPASNSTKRNVYGVMPYMAPEVLRGNPYTQASDIYSLGIIINEMITIIQPFNNQPHDHYLALDICRGLRPHIKTGTPEFLKELIKKCWDANPENDHLLMKLIF